MSYTAFYRKWRPQTLDEVRGQEAVVTTLRNQMNSGRIGHAYLFCGTRGTGKTSVAKLFARAVNCEHPVNGSPCNTCPTCQAILSGSSMNVVEIDAASNNGVDNIREIREEVRYSPTQGKYRVYIIDEVHMLSAGAYNALLKTLEEPPSYVMFILATTEVHKIPITVLSRCQRYDFKRISAGTIYEQLERLTTAEQIPVEPRALQYIARAADGALRDALSILEQCVAFHYGETLTYEQVLEVVGAVDTEVFARLLRSMMKKQVTDALNLLDEIAFSGRDIGQFVLDFVWYLRNVLMLQTNGVSEEDLGIAPEALPEMKELAMDVSMGQLMRYIRHFSGLSNSLRYASEKRAILEVAVLQMMYPQMQEDVSALQQRLDALEQQLASGQFVASSPETSARSTGSQSNAAEPKGASTAKVVELEPAVYEDWELIRKNWREILHRSGGLFRGFAKEYQLSYESESGFVVLCHSDTAFASLNTPERIQRLEDTAKAVCKKSIKLKVKLSDEVIAVVRKGQSEVGALSSIPGIQMPIGLE